MNGMREMLCYPVHVGVFYYSRGQENLEHSIVPGLFV